MLYHERFRPQYHFSASHGWMNDPNGLIFYEGEYHLFYQYNPEDICWGAPHWGHAVSSDLIHWNNLPVALFPDDLGSIFSGTIVSDENNTSGLFASGGGLVALFTHHAADGTEYQSLAYSSDKGRTWTKYAGNPVIRGKDDLAWKNFRDPKVLRWKNQWLMITGGGQYRLFVSDDLIQWKLMADMALFEEFPDLFRMDDQWVLNINGYGYYVGIMTAHGFIPQQDILPEDFANSWQACYSYENVPDNRRIWLAWMRDSAKGPTAPWRCNLSIPRELRLRKSNEGMKLLQYPIAEVENLRRPYIRMKDISIEAVDLSSAQGKYLDIELEVELHGTESFGIRCFSNGERYAEIGCRPLESLIYADTTKASSPEFDTLNTMFAASMSASGNQARILAKMYSCFYQVGKIIKLRLLLDGSTLEAFFDEGEATAAMNVYPADDAAGLHLFGKGHWVRSLVVYRMESIWSPDSIRQELSCECASSVQSEQRETDLPAKA